MYRQPRARSLQALQQHQLRIIKMIKNIESIESEPRQFSYNQKYKGPRTTFLRMRRQKQQQRIFQQNMKMIMRIEGVESKVSRSYSEDVAKIIKRRKLQKIERQQRKMQEEQSLLIENISFCRKIESIQKKVDCWADPKYRKKHKIANPANKFTIKQGRKLLDDLHIFQSSRYMKTK